MQFAKKWKTKPMICRVEDWSDYSLFPFSNKQMAVTVAYLQ